MYLEISNVKQGKMIRKTENFGKITEFDNSYLITCCLINLELRLMRKINDALNVKK